MELAGKGARVCLANGQIKHGSKLELQISGMLLERKDKALFDK